MKIPPFLIAIIILASGLAALDPRRAISQYIYEYWTAEDGLPQSFILGMIQAPDGYFWVNTQQGLSRFDGIRFQSFNRRNTPELTGLQGANAFCAFDDAFWIAAGGKLLEKRGTRWRVHTPPEIGGVSINGMSHDQAGFLWLKSDTKLFRYKNYVCQAVEEINGERFSRIYALQSDRNGQLWIYADIGVIRFDGKMFSLEFARDTLPTAIEPTCFLTDSRRNIWIGTETDGIHRFNGQKWTRISKSSDLSEDNVRCIYEDHDGNVWIGTFGGGINRYDGVAFTSFTSTEGLSNDEVTAFCEDREGSLWIATKNGLNRLKDANVTSFGEKEGIAGEFVWSVYEDRRGTIWIGSVYNGLYSYRDGKLTAYPGNRFLPHKTIRTTYEDRRGNLWIGTADGLAVDRNGVVTVYDEKNGLMNTIVRVIHEDKRGRMWIGTSGGLYIREGDSFKAYRFPPDFGRSSFFSIVEDTDGALIWGTGSGLIRIDETGSRRLAYDSGLQSWVLSVIKGSDGSLFMATNQGLGRLRGDRLSLYGVGAGLPDDVGYGIVEDLEKNLWLSTIRGICRIGISDLDALDGQRITILKPEIFNTADGMRSAEGCGGVQTAGFLSRDGKIWFPNFRGAVMLDPRNFRKNRVPPPVMIENMVADSQSFPGDHLRLAAGTRNIEFYYTALSLVAPQKNRFRYKLENFDEDWIDAGTRRVAYYTNIPPGKYVFHVSGCNNDGVWNETGASYSFTLTPFFYQTSWFLLVCIAVGLVLAFSLYWLRVRQILAHEKKLENTVQERTRELVQANHLLVEKSTQLETTNGTLAERTSQLEEANRTLERLSNLDGLTGIANRRYFEQFVDLEWRRVTREQKMLSFIMIDVDHFKLYNDRYGHLAGDDALKKVAAGMNVANRAGDLVARYGGEEFIVVLPNTDAAGAFHLAEKMRMSVEQQRIETDNSPVSDHVTISLGVAATLPGGGGNFLELILKADRALYRAKQEGRNCTQIFSEIPGEKE